MHQRRPFVTRIGRCVRVAIGPDSAMQELAPTLREKDLGGASKVDNDRLVGIFPGRDRFRMRRL